MPDELERLRQERLRQLIEQQKRSQEQESIQESMRAAEIEKQIKLIISRILTPEARERLSNIKLVKPAFARQIEIFLIQLHQSGRLPQQVTDEQLKNILEKIKGQKREINIKKA